MTLNTKAGKKLYILVNKNETCSWLTREDARRAKRKGDLLLTITLSKSERKRLGGIIQEILDDVVTEQVNRSSENV